MLISFRTIVAVPGWVKSQDPNPGSGSRMNNPYYIPESLETIFWAKILKFFDTDPGSRMKIFGSENRDPGWKKFIPDPQHCLEHD
jgi:hypothetical protein